MAYSGQLMAQPDATRLLSPATEHMLRELGTSGLAVCTATAFTNPIDVVKVRVQLAPASGASAGIAGTALSIARNEGLLAMWKGVTPAMARGMIYGGLRLGLYTPIKSVMGVDSKHDPWSVYKKIAAGVVSGGIAAGITNPTELVKTRLQAAGCTHTSSSAVIRDVVATSGVIGLWRGTVPSMARAALLTASQCATYDVVKRQLISATNAAEDSVATQLTSGAITGLITTTVTAPADVLKTRMFAAGGEGVIASAAALMREGGPAVFFKGWLANYARLGPQTLITFLAAEQLRKLFGLNAL